MLQGTVRTQDSVSAARELLLSINEQEIERRKLSANVLVTCQMIILHYAIGRFRDVFQGGGFAAIIVTVKMVLMNLRERWWPL